MGARPTFKQENQMATITVNGMKCQHCASTTKNTLEGIDGISSVRVELETGQVHFDGTADMDVIKTAISKAGFEVVT